MKASLINNQNSPSFKAKVKPIYFLDFKSVKIAKPIIKDLASDKITLQVANKDGFGLDGYTHVIAKTKHNGKIVTAESRDAVDFKQNIKEKAEEAIIELKIRLKHLMVKN